MKTPQLMLTLLLALFVFSAAHAQNNTPPNQPQPPANVHQQPQMQAPVTGGVPGAPQQNMHAPPAHPGPFSHANLTYQVMELPDHTFGYNLFADGKMVWQQYNVNMQRPNPAGDAPSKAVPAAPVKGPGNGFHSKPEAERAAQLAMEKMKRGEMPPVVTMEDLRQPPVKQ